MYDVYNCPGCYQAHRLDEQVCSNCDRYGAISLNQPEERDPYFECSNCLDWTYGLRCPNCSTSVKTPFVETIWEKQDKIGAGVIGVLAVVGLSWLINN